MEQYIVVSIGNVSPFHGPDVRLLPIVSAALDQRSQVMPSDRALEIIADLS